MQKFIRICAIVAVALVALPIFFLIITTPFQSAILRLFGCPVEQIAAGLIFPWIPIVMLFLRLGIMMPLVITAGKRGNIVMEIILILCMMVVLPGINELVSILQNVIIGRFGTSHIALNSYVNAYIVRPCTGLAGYGQALAYVVCGMRIASKLLHRKMEKELVD